MLETLDYTIRIGSTQTFYISICISTLPTQDTTFIIVFILIAKFNFLSTFDVVEQNNFKKKYFKEFLSDFLKTKHRFSEIQIEI